MFGEQFSEPDVEITSAVKGFSGRGKVHPRKFVVYCSCRCMGDLCASFIHRQHQGPPYKSLKRRTVGSSDRPDTGIEFKGQHLIGLPGTVDGQIGVFLPIQQTVTVVDTGTVFRDPQGDLERISAADTYMRPAAFWGDSTALL